MAVDNQFLDSILSGDLAGSLQPADSTGSRSYLKQSGLKDIVALSPEGRAADRATNENPAVKNELLKEIGRAKDPAARAALEQELKRQGGDPSASLTADPVAQAIKPAATFQPPKMSAREDSTRFKDYALDNNPAFGGTAAKTDSNSFSVSKEIGAAIDSYQANLWAIPAAMGSEYALQAMLDNKAAAEKGWQDSGAPQSFDEMEFGKNFGQYFAHMALQSSPYMLEFMATGFGVGSAAKAALSNTAKGIAEKAAMEAAKLGATKAAAQKAGEAAAASYMGKVYTASGIAGSYPSAVGDVLSNQHEQAGKFDLPTAAALGVPYAALNAAGAEGMAVRAVARGLPKSAIAKEGVAGFAGRAALTGAEAGIMGGSTETGQEVMNQLGRMAVDPDAKIDDHRALKAYKESFIAGTLLGGVPGAAAGGFRKPEDANLKPAAQKPNSPLTNAAKTAQPKDALMDALAPITAKFASPDFLNTVRGNEHIFGTGVAGALDLYRAAINPSLYPAKRIEAIGKLTRIIDMIGSLPGRAAQSNLNQQALLADEEGSEYVGDDGVQQQYANQAELQQLITEEKQRQQAAIKDQWLDQHIARATQGPTPGFGNMVEYENFLREQLDQLSQLRAEAKVTNDQKKAQEAQQKERELADIAKRVEDSRSQESSNKRDDLLSRVLASNPQNPNRAFDRALRLEGFRDSTFTEAEKAKIARFGELRQMQEEGSVGTPNEGGDFGIKAKPEQAATQANQNVANMLNAGWQLQGKQLVSPKGEKYNLKAGEAQFVRNKLNQKAGNGSQSPRGGSQGGTDQGNFGVGGAGANGPVPQGGGNGSGQANAIPDTGAPAGAIQSSEAVGNGGQSNNPLARSRLTALDDTRIAKYADDLRSMAPDSGWAEEGGRLLIAPDGTKSRTKWIPRAEWFVAGMLNSPRESVAAVEKAISGQPMRKAEKLHVQGMMDFLDMQHGIDGDSHAEQLATLSDIAYEGESADAQSIIDTLGDVDLESIGAWGDEVESMRALGFTEEEINEITRRKQGAFGAIGEEATGVPAGETQGAIPEGDGNGDGQAEGQEGFSLNQQTNQQASAEYKRQQAEQNATEKEPPAKNVTGDQVDMFNTQGGLFSSNRDTAPKAGSAAASPAGVKAPNVGDFIEGPNGYRIRVNEHKAGSNLIDPTADAGALTYEVRKGNDDANPLTMVLNKDGKLVDKKQVMNADGSSNGTAFVPPGAVSRGQLIELLRARAKTDVGSSERAAIDQKIKEIVTGYTKKSEPAQSSNFDVSNRTDTQLNYLTQHGQPGWKEAAVAELQKRGVQVSTPQQAKTDTLGEDKPVKRNALGLPEGYTFATGKDSREKVSASALQHGDVIHVDGRIIGVDKVTPRGDGTVDLLLDSVGGKSTYNVSADRQIERRKIVKLEQPAQVAENVPGTAQAPNVTEPAEKQRYAVGHNNTVIAVEPIHDVTYPEMPGRVFYTRQTEQGLFNVVDAKSGQAVFLGAASEDVAISNFPVRMQELGLDRVKERLESLPDIQAPKQEAAQQQEETDFEHAGYKIYRSRVNVAGEVKDYWAVQTKENRQKGKVGFGDTLHETKEQAIKAAERQQKDVEATAKYEADEQAKRDAEAKAKAEKEADTYNGFLDGKTPAKKGLIRKALAKEWRLNGVVVNVRDYIESGLANGDLRVSTYEENKIKPMSRTAFNRATQREQDAHEKKVREGGKVTVYEVNGFDLGKTAYDYAQHLLTKAKAETPAVNAVSQQKTNTVETAEQNQAPAITPENDAATKLRNGEINVLQFMEASGLTDDDVGTFASNGLRDQAEKEAKAASPYHAGIAKLSAAIYAASQGLNRGSTAQSRKEYDKNTAKYNNAQSTLGVIAKSYEHPFNNNLLSKLPDFLKQRYGKHWDSISYGEAAKRDYYKDSYSRWVELLIKKAEEKPTTVNAENEQKSEQPNEYETKQENLAVAEQYLKETERFYAMSGSGMRFGKMLRDALLSDSQSRLVGTFSVKSGKAITKTSLGKAKLLANKYGKPIAVVQILDDAGVPVAGVMVQVPFKDQLSSDDDFSNRKIIEEIGGVGEVVYPESNAKATANSESTVALNQQNSADSDFERGKAMMAAGLDKLITLLGGKTNMLPEEEAQIIPVMSQIFRGAALMGYAKFKEASRFVLDTLRSKSPEVADKIDIENLQAGYINAMKSIEGASTKAEIIEFDSVDQLYEDRAQFQGRIAAAEQRTALNPTDAQKESGIYAKGKFAWKGMTISIETPKGAERSGTDESGQRWSITAPTSYGYFLSTTAADKEHLDVYIGDKPESDRVYVINQTKVDSLKLDEHKILIGFDSEEDAKNAYFGAFSEGFAPRVFGSIAGPFSVDEFKAMLPKLEKARFIEDRVTDKSERLVQEEKRKYEEAAAKAKAKEEERNRPKLDQITVTRSATLDGKEIEYDQKADEALNEIDGQMTLAKRLLECLAA